MEITAKEIERQAGRLEEQIEKFGKISSDMIEILHHLSNVIDSEDSNLSTVLKQYANSYIALNSRVSQKFMPLANIMHKYVSDTISNEENTSIDVNKLGNEVENITVNI